MTVQNIEFRDCKNEIASFDIVNPLEAWTDNAKAAGSKYCFKTAARRICCEIGQMTAQRGPAQHGPALPSSTLPSAAQPSAAQ